MTLREQLLAPRTAPAGTVTLPGRGVTAHVRRLTLRERLAVESLLSGGDRPLRERALAVCAIGLGDDRNARLFDDAEAQTTLPEALDAADPELVIEATLRLNGMTRESADAGKPSSPPTAT